MSPRGSRMVQSGSSFVLFVDGAADANSQERKVAKRKRL